jgi:hypothetical protein
MKFGDPVLIQWGLDEVKGEFISFTGPPGRPQVRVRLGRKLGGSEVVVPLGSVRSVLSEAEPARPSHEQRKKRTHRWKQVAQGIGVLAGLATIAALILEIALNVTGGSTSSLALTPPASSIRCGAIPAHKPDRLTIENDAGRGVWSRTTHTYFGRFFPHAVRPRNGARWLPNCTVVRVECLSDGTAYRFVQQYGNGAIESLRWKAWVHVSRTEWLPLAAFAESTGLERPTLPIRPCR